MHDNTAQARMRYTVVNVSGIADFNNCMKKYLPNSYNLDLNSIMPEMNRQLHNPKQESAQTVEMGSGIRSRRAIDVEGNLMVDA